MAPSSPTLTSFRSTLRNSTFTSRLFSLFLLSCSYRYVHADYDTRPVPEAKEGWFTKFRSRPDLQVPIWNITIHDESKLAPGHWFVSPYENVHPPEDDSPPWVTPCIYDAQGELLWSAGDMFHNRNTQDFRVSEVLGEAFLSMIYQDGGVGLMVDESYEERYSVDIGVNMDTLNIHDWNVVHNGTRVLNFKKYLTNAPKDDALAFGYSGDCSVEYQIFYERDAANNFEPIFEWNSYDHIGLDESNYRRGESASRLCTSGWYDYFHANSVDRCPDGDFVLSARHTDTIYKIRRSDGGIAWRLGGAMDDFSHDFKFARQHDVRCTAQNETHTTVTFLDNAVGADPNPPTHDCSRGVVITVDTRSDKMHATLISSYDHPRGKLSDGRGGMQTLPNGNVVMGWSGGGEHAEFTEDGDVVMEGNFIPHYLRTYRTYKFPWVGRPKRGPDVLSEVIRRGQSYYTEVYASWNGATEHKFWKLYKSDSTGKITRLLSTIPRKGFETKIAHSGFFTYVVVEGLDADGKSLGRSNVITTETIDNMPPEILEEELAWLQNPVGDDEGTSSHVLPISASNGGVSYMFAGFMLAIGLGCGFWLARRVFFSRSAAFLRTNQQYELVDGSEKDDDTRENSYSMSNR